MRRRGKKKERMILYGSALIVALMLLSTIGFFISGGSNSNRYGKYSFSRPDRSNLWYTVIDGKSMAFYNFPADIDHIELEPAVLDKIKDNNMVYITYDPENPFRESIALISLELSEVLWDSFKVYAELGFTKETEYTEKTITCDNAMPTLPVIYFMESNETKIGIEDNCIRIEGQSVHGFIMLYERLVYGLLGVIE